VSRLRPVPAAAPWRRIETGQFAAEEGSNLVIRQRGVRAIVGGPGSQPPPPTCWMCQVAMPAACSNALELALRPPNQAPDGAIRQSI